jgi:L-2-hydroxyglutarate oxidase LhgO
MTFDTVVIGAGIVGLACARECSRKGHPTLLIERNDSFGQETSSHNSEVLHSGIYYPTGSLKARLCVAANRAIYDECERLGVWSRRCGKLIVAVTEDEEPDLQALFERGMANGVEGMQILDGPQVAKLEPHIRCRSAIFIPGTGIVDSHELMKAYLREAREMGTDILYGAEFLGGVKTAGRFELTIREHTGEPVKIETEHVINAAGLSCDQVAEGFGIDIDSAGYRLHPNRGHYFAVAPAKGRLVSHLVYPVPSKHLVGTGIHMTIDRVGRMKLGPDTEYIDRSLPRSAWYRFDPSRKEKFFDAVVAYFPDLSIDDLTPDQIGVRPKIRGSDSEVRDFVIASESGRGLAGLVNLIGIESPGLTCAAMIAEEAVRTMPGN